MSITDGYHGFAALDFYFGCALRTTLAGVTSAIPCNITVEGFTKTGQKVASKKFVYDPEFNLLVPQPMVKAVLPVDFRKTLAKMTLQQDDPILQGLLIDNNRYVLKA